MPSTNPHRRRATLFTEGHLFLEDLLNNPAHPEATQTSISTRVPWEGCRMVFDHLLGGGRSG